MLRQSSWQIRTTTFVIITVLTWAPLMIFPFKANSLKLLNRSLRVGSTLPSANTTNEFSFEYASTDSVGSIRFEYCMSPLVMEACVPPIGLNASGAVLSDQSGETGFTVQNRTANVIVLTRSAAPSSIVQSRYTFTNVVNPSSVVRYYARISTFETSDATGAYTDFGGLGATTTRGIGITTEVPPILNFCVGITIPGDCTTADGNFIEFGELQTGQTATGTSQMLGSTNADFGYVISANGRTMSSGNNVIRALNTPAPSQAGQPQFGINLRANSSPSVGEELTGIGITVPAGDYNIPDQFKYVNGEVVAYTPDVTEWTKLTVSYVVNIAQNQPVGIYSTTITFVALATF